MNQNDKLPGAEFEVSAQAISDEELDTVAGGCEHHDPNYYAATPPCVRCGYKYMSVNKPCPCCGASVEEQIGG